jgi:C-terminal processing protease CtpA/Prc
MFRERRFSGLMLAFAALLLLLSTQVFAQTRMEDAEIQMDEGGAVFIRGEAKYTFPYFRMFLPRPFVVLYDITGAVVDRNIDFYPAPSSQAFGTITTDPFTSPFQYEIALPARPNGERRDVDNDGEEDQGVMIFSLVVASNTWGDPFLEERDNFVAGILNSALISTDIDSFLEVEGGTLLIYASDEKQGFPAGYGDDDLLFTDDDPVVRVPQGYTLVDLSNRESFVFNRAAEPEVALLEAEDAELDDFSDLSYVEAFDAMIELLRREYAFTEYKAIDWESILEVYRPRIEAAQQENDLESFREALAEIALSIPDGHVSGPVDFDIFRTEVSGGLGLALRELDDGRVVVSYLVAGGPAELAGVKPRAEILEVNGKPIREALEETRLWSSASTPHSRRLEQLTYVVRFPIDTEVELTFRNPGDDEIRTAEITSVFDSEGFENSGYQVTGEDPVPGEMPVEYVIREDGFAYVKIYSFTDDLPLIVSLWERFIEEITALGVMGVVIDMRENGGGSGFLGDQLPAYFFDEAYVIGNTARYSEARGGFVINPQEQDKFILPPNNLYYDGPVAVIISPNCASACESFAWAMTVNNRAAIVGNYPTAGLGGSVVPIALPDDTTFNYTNTRSLDAEGNISIEGIGVLPTVRVPVTEETLFSDEDALLNAALDYLRAELNFVAIGAVVQGEIRDGEPVQYRLPLKEGETFSIRVHSDAMEPTLRLYAPGVEEPLLEDAPRRGVASLDGLRAPFDVTLVVEVSADDDGAYELQIIQD